MPSYRAIRADRIENGVSFFDVLTYVTGYWRRQPVRLGIYIVLSVSAALVETSIPNALSRFLGSVREHTANDVVYRNLALFIGVYLVQLALGWTSSMIYNVFETRVFKAVVDDAFAHVQRLPEYYFANTFTGSIITKITRARNRIEGFEDQMLGLLPTLAVLIGSAWFLSRRFPGLAVLMCIYLVVVIAFSTFLLLRIVGPAQGESAEAQDKFGGQLADTIGGMATTKSFAQEPRELINYQATSDFLRGKTLHSYILSSSAGYVQRLLIIGMLTLLLGGGTWYFLQGKATVESMAYLAFAYTIIQSYIRNLGENIKNIMTSSYDLHGVVALLREKPEDADRAVPDLTITRGEIVFDDVHFTYPDKSRSVFDGLNVTIRAGERVALVGHSGSGKSSFVRLLQGLYQPQGGSIRVDGQNIHSGSLRSLRAAIALVPQDPALFHRTLAANIAYGRPDADHAAVRVAARQANIDDFIMGLPKGYDTLVGERGIKLSGGERQRIAIARAILADRPILILDEATSSLDSASERAIQDALFRLMQSRTSIMIAHRLSTIMDADRILVFDEGKIVEEGTHDALIARDGAYADFFRIQSGGFIEAG